MEKKVLLGVDIGGTKIRAGLVSDTGILLFPSVEILTNASSRGNVIISNLMHLIRTLISKSESMNYEVVGIGVGCTGPIDYKHGIILNVLNLPTLNYFPLKQKISDEFGLPVLVDNDANAFVLAEALFGNAHTYSSVLGITLGTGLGCAWVINGGIWHGCNGCAGEIWQSPYKDSILENYVSGNGVVRMYKDKVGYDMSTYDIVKKAAEGDKDALEVWEEFSDGLAYGLSWVVNMIDPEVIVIGGGLVQVSDLYLDRVRIILQKMLNGTLGEKIDIKTSLLGQDAGVIGAASLFLCNDLNV